MKTNSTGAWRATAAIGRPKIRLLLFTVVSMLICTRYRVLIQVPRMQFQHGYQIIQEKCGIVRAEFFPYSCYTLH